MSLVLALLFIRERPADVQAQEDEEFRQFLISEGFDVSVMGKSDEIVLPYEEKDLGTPSPYVPDVKAEHDQMMAPVP